MFHVHDEVIIDAPVSITVDEICDLMAEPIPWAPGLILKKVLDLRVTIT